MRNLFLALLLANLAFAAWSRWFAEPSAIPGFISRDLPGITLVSELDEDEIAALELLAAERAALVGELEANAGNAGQAAVDTSDVGQPAVDTTVPPAEDPEPELSAAAPVASVLERCVSVGPFRELSQAAAASSNLRAGGHVPSQRVEEGEIWVGYWVYLDEIATVAEANDTLARVREGGVADSYVIPGTETGSIVSLGVFSDISRAGRRREELRELGYEPVIADQTQRATVYWVDVTLAPEETLDFDALQAPGRIIRLEQRTCPAEDV